MNKERRQVKGGIHHIRGVIQANSNVLQTYKLTSNILDHDE